MYGLLRRILFRLDAETAHELALKWLAHGWVSGAAGRLAGPVPSVPTRVMGLDFPNPVGLAAGLDKNGECIDGLSKLGFGFLEVGTVTPRPQSGNPRPRLFRLPQADALINRMGFNNLGVDRLLEALARSRYPGVMGINIGKNRNTPTERAVDDYLDCLRRVYEHASYVTVNISSPNTPGLRALQHGDALESLLAALKTAQTELANRHDRYVPLVVKLAPDLTPDELTTLAESIQRHGIDGVIATNTTNSRDGVEGLPNADQTGGLSGRPLAGKSTEVIRALHQRLGAETPVIGVGGILDPRDALAKLDAGAALVQIYTGFIYRGPALVGDAVRAIAHQRNLGSLTT